MVRTVAFDHIVSLGSDCDTAQVLQEAGWHQTPSVFDWLITPWDAMMAVLSDNGRHLATGLYPSHGGLGAACAQADVGVVIQPQWKRALPVRGHAVVLWHDLALSR